MALVTCRECGKEVSEEAKVCPNCGIKTPSKKRHKRGIYILIVMLLAVLGTGAWGYFRITGSAPPTNGNGISAPPKIQKDIPVKQQVMQKDYKEKVSEMLDSGISVVKISKQTGIRIDEVRRIKKEKKKAAAEKTQ